MDILQLASDLLPSILSIIACLVAFFKGRGVSTLTADQIEAKAEAKKQKLITKLNKKNKIKPIEATAETIPEVSNVGLQFNQEEFLKNLKTGGVSHGYEESANV